MPWPVWGEIYTIGVGQHTAVLSATVLYEYVPNAIKLIGEVLTNPSFPAEELGRLINDRKRQLSLSKTQPRLQAYEKFCTTIYPEHSYGRIYPTVGMLNTYTLEHVKDFYAGNFGAKRTTVYVAGKFDAKQTREAIESVFKEWEEGEDADYPIAEPTTVTAIDVMDRPDALQSMLIVGLPVPDPSHPDYVALDITNSLLGGSFGSRITSR